jgi:hypothetical protein
MWTLPNVLEDHIEQVVHPMAISNELSGDIAAAILSTADVSPAQRYELKNTVLKVHSILQAMSLPRRKGKLVELARPEDTRRPARFTASGDK